MELNDIKAFLYLSEKANIGEGLYSIVANFILEDWKENKDGLYTYLEDCLNGCSSGIFTNLITYYQTNNFFDTYYDEIVNYINDESEENKFYLKKWDNDLKNDIVWNVVDDVLTGMFCDLEDFEVDEEELNNNFMYKLNLYLSEYPFKQEKDPYYIEEAFSIIKKNYYGISIETSRKEFLSLYRDKIHEYISKKNFKYFDLFIFSLCRYIDNTNLEDFEHWSEWSDIK